MSILPAPYLSSVYRQPEGDYIARPMIVPTSTLLSWERGFSFPRSVWFPVIPPFGW